MYFRLLALCLAIALASPASAQDNPVTDGIALWLRADVGVTVDASNRVESWQDQSDSGFVFTHVDGIDEDQRPSLGQGVLDGQNVVRFDGVDDFLSGGDVLDDVFASDDQKFVLFAVFIATSGVGNIILAKHSDSSFGEDQRQIIYRVRSNNVMLYTTYQLAGPYREASGTTNVVDSLVVASFEYDSSSLGNNGLDQFTIRLNGGSEDLFLIQSSGTPGAIANGTAPVSVGAATSTSGLFSKSYFQGDIAEILLYDRLLSDSEREQVEDYLGAKYGVTVGVADEDGADVQPVYRLSAIRPNPFSSQATFHLEIDQAQQVRVAVHDLLGREVAVLHNGVLPPGESTFDFRRDGLTSGVYFVRVVGERFTAVQRAAVLK